MKKLLGLLGTIMITGNAIPSIVAAAPNRKHSIKKRQNNENTSTTPKPQDDKQPQFSITSDSKVDIIEKEITLNENYSDNIQKMLQELIDENYINPLRSINMGGLVSKELDNKTIISKLEEFEPKVANWFKNQQNNKDKILILTLKNSNNESVKLVINLNNLYLLGFINNQNQYFYFNDEILKIIEQINQEEITKLNNLKDKLNNLKENNFLSNEKKVKEYLQQKNEVIPLKTKEKNNKKLNYNNELNSLNKKIINLRGENLKDDEEKIKTINNTVIKKYNYQKINLNYTGAYSEDGLNVVIKQNEKPEGKDIFISQDTLNNAIANLSKYDNNKQENQTIKDDLVRMIFITSEAIRFQCDEKTLNIFVKIENISEITKIINNTKNILKNIQEKIFDKKEGINWKDYTSQLRGDWKKYSEQLNKFRIEIWNKLNEFKKIFNFIGDSKNEIYEYITTMEKINVSEEGVQLLQKEQKNNLIQKMETNGLKNYEKIFNSLHNLKQNVFNKNKLGEIIFYNYENLNLTILLNNFDLTRFLVVIGADVNLQDENGRTPLFVATSINNPEMVQLLLDNGADINLQNKNGITPLNFAVIKKNLKMVQLLLDKGANVSIQNELITLISEIFYNKEEDDFSEFDNSIPEVADDNLQDENDRNSLGKSDWFIDLIFRRKLILKMQDSFKMAKILINNAADVNDQKKSELIYLIYEKLHNDAKNDKFDTKNIFLDSVKGYDLGDINTILKLRENIQIKLAFKDSNGHEIKNNPEIVQLLLDKGADVNLQNKNGDIPLITAIKNNDLKMVQLLLDNGADINLQNKNVDIPLITAIKNNDLKMVQLLLDKGADVNLQNKNGLIPLDYAMDRNNKELVQFLIDNGAGVNIKDWFGCTPLHNAIIKDNLKMVQFLIDKGADVNIQDWFGFTPLITAIKNNDLKMFQFLIDNGAGVNIQDWFGCTPLHNAIIKDNLKMVQLLLDKGADVKFHNKNGDAILITAIKNNDLKMFQLLLDNGAGVNIQDENGHTPLNYAIYGNNKELFQLLIDKGANVNIQNKNGHTPLITSIDRNNKELFQLLLDNGADVNIQDKNGHTPLITSIDRNNKELFQLLLDNGADVNIQDKNGHTPLSVAKYLNNQEIVQLLIAKGAKLIVNEISNDNNAVSDNKNPVGSKKSNNENQRYDVLPDGSCLFWTVATSYLLPVRNNNDEFRARFIKLFGEQELQNLLYVQNLLQQFNLENNRDLNQLWYQNQTANNLVTNVFRNRVVDYIQSNLNMITNRGSELTFRNLIQENNEIDNNYLDRMREPSTWGGTPEILATTNMLNANISVNNDIPYQPVNQNSNNTINIFHVNGNHYNFGLENQIPQTDAEYKKSTGGGCLTEEDNDIENNSSSLNFPQLKKDEYHFINQKTEQNSLKNDENLNIYLIKNENKIINKYNSLSKEQKQQKLNEINQHYQNLSENNKKVFIDKLKTIGSAALGAGISGVGTKITVGGSTSTTIGAEATGEAIEMTPLLSEGGLTAAETLSVAEGTAVVASEGAVIGTEAGAAAALAPETLGLSLVIGGLVITGTALIWWLNHDNNDRPEAVKNESHNQYNEVEKYYQFLSHDQLKLDININTWDKIKQIYQANKDNYEGFKEQIKATITSFHKEDHSGWGGSITDEDTNTLINIIYSHFQEINTHFTNNPNHGWKIVTNTIGSYFIIEEE